MKYKTCNIKKTCRNSCLFFDSTSQKCGIYNGVNLDSHQTIGRCQHYSDYIDFENEIYELIENKFTLEISDNDFLFQIMGDYFQENTSTYPLKPDFDSNRKDAIWYIAPDKTYGCWIINHYKRRFFPVIDNQEIKIGWSKKVYRSPYPLYNHNSSLSLSSRMCWYIDQDGWGQYVLLVNGEIKMISSPKPKNWLK